MRYGWLLLLLGVSFGCADLKKTEQLERIAALRTQLEILDATVARIDTLDLEVNLKKAEIVVQQLKQLEADTISRAEAENISTLKNLRTDAEQLQNVASVVREKRTAMGQRLDRLERDIETGSGRRDKYDSYLSQEEATVTQWEGLMERYLPTIERFQNDWTNAIAAVEHLLDERFQESTLQEE
jgi:hypothetical protein